MTSSLRAWFETRPTTAPSTPIPPRPNNVLAFARSADATAELRIIRRPDGYFTFEIEAWTNFEDAGGGAHHSWHTFHPPAAFFTDSFDIAVENALADAETRQLVLHDLERVARIQSK